MPPPGPTPRRRSRWRLGATLKGKYRLDDVLGTGGMATVYLGVHRNGFRVAVKILHPELSAGDTHAAQALREGYVANAIEHRGAVRVLDDDVAEDGSRFLVMELLDGESLEARRRRSGGTLPVREALVLGHQLLDVLAAAHAKSIVHRDIKPANLFLTVEGELKVLDFGLARIRDPQAISTQSTLGGGAMGTPPFMPPEQALGMRDEIDARTDVWAAGATLFTLLSGKFVHEGTTGAAIVARAATQPARSLASVSPDAPAPVVDLIDRALRFRKDERWPSARAMQQAIAEAYAALQGEPISAASIDPPPSRIARRADRASRLSGLDPQDADVDQTLESIPPGSPFQGATTVPVDNPLEISPPGGPFQGATTVPVDNPLETSSWSSSPGEPPLNEQVADDRAEDDRPTTHDTPVPASPPPGSRRRAGAAAIAVCLAAAVAAAFVARERPGSHGTTARDAPAAAPRSCDANAACNPDEVCGPALRCIPRTGCASNAECVSQSGGKPAVCRKAEGRCAPLEVEGCRVLAGEGDITNDATLWVGAMFPVTGGESFGQASMNAVELARRDLAETSNGLPALRPGGPPRPIAVVACDDAHDPHRVARHLVDDVGAPAILGFARSKEVLDLASSLFLPRKVLALASNTASMLKTLPRSPDGPRLVFRTTTSVDMGGPPTSALISQLLEPELRRAPGLLGPGEPIRVALVRIANPSGLDTRETIIETLRFNGKTVAQNGPDFLEVVVPDNLHGEPRAEVAGSAAKVAALRPHILIGAGIEMDFVREVERSWPAQERFRPRYVHAGVPLDGWAELLAELPGLRERTFSLDAVSSTGVRAKFVLRYNDVFSPKVTAASATCAPYDAFYLLAYAAAALGDQPITGVGLARSIERLLPPGDRIDVGPSGIYPTFHALMAGKKVDLEGTMTSLDFNLDTGDATADFAVFCPEGRGASFDMVESGLVYDARSGQLKGELRCH